MGHTGRCQIGTSDDGRYPDYTPMGIQIRCTCGGHVIYKQDHWECTSCQKMYQFREMETGKYLVTKEDLKPQNYELYDGDAVVFLPDPSWQTNVIVKGEKK